MRVTFLHPDLGIGGAERLIVDAAVALQNKGHHVKIVTAQFDSSHAFKETENIDIEVVKWFPRDLFGRCLALCAYIRMCLAALYVCANVKSDVIICDQVSACLALLRLFSSARLVFYCHYPDMLLTDRETTLKSIYRSVLDTIEERTTKMADTICVNSRFTASVVTRTFKSVDADALTVVYPSLNTKVFDDMDDCDLPEIPPSASHVFLSLNRFEMKKNIKLALDSFSELNTSGLLSSDEFFRCFLVIAGGFDKHNPENLVCHHKLKEYAVELGIHQKQILFLRSPSDAVKVALLRRSTAVLYTPSNEHFGIVPVEAMYLGCPVIATNSGGPTESIANGQTGFLVEPEPHLWAQIMAKLVKNPEIRDQMTSAGPERVRKMFAFNAFADRLDAIVKGDI